MSSSLLDAVAAETSALERFIAILEEEQQLLIGGNADAVLPLLEQKTALIAELGAAGQHRDTALSQLGVATADKASIERWLAGVSPEIRTAWDTLLERARAANRLNSTNGELINTRLQHNQQALAVLMSAANPDGATTYGPDGHQRHGAGSRPLGRA